MYGKLLCAVELFGRRKPVPDEAEILELGLDLLVRSLEKKKFAATDKPRAARHSTSPRHISNEVKREVSERDGGQCTFVSDEGTACPARMNLEYDHIVAIGKGGTSEASNVRLRCRAHNQYEAERVYGKPFMQNKREQAKAAAAKRQAEREAKKAAQEAIDHDELMPGLRGLGFSKEEARFALSKCSPVAGMTIETRFKRCLALLAPPCRKISPGGAIAT
jgi:5-methylcytosine-specific restriction endonuclease McrA